MKPIFCEGSIGPHVTLIKIEEGEIQRRSNETIWDMQGDAEPLSITQVVNDIVLKLRADGVFGEKHDVENYQDKYTLNRKRMYHLTGGHARKLLHLCNAFGEDS